MVTTYFIRLKTILSDLAHGINVRKLTSMVTTFRSSLIWWHSPSKSEIKPASTNTKSDITPHIPSPSRRRVSWTSKGASRRRVTTKAMAASGSAMPNKSDSSYTKPATSSNEFGGGGMHIRFDSRRRHWQHERVGADTKIIAPGGIGTSKGAH